MATTTGRVVVDGRHHRAHGSRTDPDDVARSLAGTALADAPLTEVPLPEAPGATWVIDLGGGDVVAAWREAREAVSALGLYPVAVTTWGLPDWPAADLFSRFYYGGDEDVAPRSVIARSRALSVEEALLRFTFGDEWAAENWDDVVRHHLELTRRHAGAAADAGRSPMSRSATSSGWNAG